MNELQTITNHQPAAAQAKTEGGAARVRLLHLARVRRRADPGRLRREGARGRHHLRGSRLGPARHQRPLPPRDLATQGPALDEAPGPLDDLRTDRRDLHARGAARAEGVAGESDPDRAVGRGTRGVLFKLLSIDAPKWLFAAVYVALGLVTAAVFGELPAAIGWLGVAGLATGGLLYLLGAVVYASGRPEPVAAGVRLPRGLPRPGGGRRRPAVRGDRLRGPARG